MVIYARFFGEDEIALFRNGKVVINYSLGGGNSHRIAENRKTVTAWVSRFYLSGRINRIEIGHVDITYLRPLREDEEVFVFCNRRSPYGRRSVV